MAFRAAWQTEATLRSELEEAQTENARLQGAAGLPLPPSALAVLEAQKREFEVVAAALAQTSHMLVRSASARLRVCSPPFGPSFGHHWL